MGVIVPEGFNNATFVFNCLGLTDEIVTTLGFADDIISPHTPNSMASVIRNAFIGSNRPFQAANMTTEYTFQGVRITRTVGGLPVLGEDMTPTVGTQSLDSIPANCAVLIKKNTAAGGRRNRGRMYLPAVALQGSDVLPSGFLASGEAAARQTQFDGAITALAAFSILPVLFHSDGGTPTAISSFSVEAQLGTQRRRMR